MLDVVIVGGGVAGLSTALMLDRSRRRVLLCNAGTPRNAPSPESHSFFSRDGTPPLELLRIGRAQLRPYETIEVRDTVAKVLFGPTPLVAHCAATGRGRIAA